MNGVERKQQIFMFYLEALTFKSFTSTVTMQEKDFLNLSFKIICK